MGARVLVVDDSPTIRKVVTGILARSGYDAVGAADGIAALDLLSDESAPKVELLLLDFVMPRMTGYELCRRLRSDERLKALPVVLMSAKTEKIREQFVEQTGALDAISKPFDARALLAVVENTLQKVEQGRTARVDVPPPPDSGERPVGTSEPPPPASRPDLAAFSFSEKLADVMRTAIEGLPGAEGIDRDVLAARLTTALDPGSMTKLLGDLEEWAESAGPREVLRGRGDAVPLGEILQVLQMQMQSGVLTVSQGKTEVVVVFRGGLIDVAQSRGVSDEFRLGRYLVEEGLVAKDQLEQAAETARAEKARIGDTLVAKGIIQEADLRRALIRQSSELIYEILRWPRPRFSFRKQGATEGQPPPSNTPELGLPVASLVMEGFQRVDEWRLFEEHIDFEGVLYQNAAAIEKLGPDRLDKGEKRILELVDGERPVREIVRMSHASSFDACKTLYQFLEARIVRRRTA